MKRETTRSATRPDASKSAARKGLTPRARRDVGEGSRPIRIAVQLKQEVARLLGRDLADPRLEGLVISNAWISSDLRLAKVYFRIATISEGVEFVARREEAEKALERASGRVRKIVTARLGLRVAPELRFVYDEGQDARSRIEELIEEVKRESSRK